jgi:hypothetical protein
MTRKFPICPDRIRSIPEQFSWVDHRLVRDRHIECLSHEAAMLNLFLVTVSDSQGLSYYSAPSPPRDGCAEARLCPYGAAPSWTGRLQEAHYRVLPLGDSALAAFPDHSGSGCRCG